MRRVRGRTDGANELDLDARVLKALAILGSHRDLALDRLAIEVQRDLFFAGLVELDVNGGAVVEVLEDDVNIDGGGEEVGHSGRRGACRLRRGDAAMRRPSRERVGVQACGVCTWAAVVAT
jgi:hypothetical protein